MTSRGRPAALPPLGWQPPVRHKGDRVEFVSEDGRQRRTYDASRLPGDQQVKGELVTAFAAATGPLGTFKRKASANALWTAVRRTTSWLAASRPHLRTLGELSIADARSLLLSMRQPSGYIPVGAVRALFAHCPQVSDLVREELARHRNPNTQKPPQPYTPEELRWITTAARGIVRRARARLEAHWQLVADYRSGRLAGRGADDPQHRLGEALDHCARHGSAPGKIVGGHGQDLMSLLHLAAGEAWAFAVLLAALTGLNGSTIYDLPAPHSTATGIGEPGIALVRAVKWRRGPRAAMTVPLAALRTELRPPAHDRRPQHVLNSSLTTPFGVFTLLVGLTAPARAQLGDDHAFVFYSQPRRRLATGDMLRVRPDLRRAWLEPVLSGDLDRDAVLLDANLSRLRKTFLAQQRRPVAHTPGTFHRYLQAMSAVREDGSQIVRETLDAQVRDALARRRMQVEHHDPKAPGLGDALRHDTVLAACTDFDHSPLDGGRPCRQAFLSCLDCTNARAFPRHLPVQLLVLDELHARRQQVSAGQWATEFAGRAAQLEEIVNDFEPAQRAQARAQITDVHRGLVQRLLAGDLDPL
jgi:hypothetical protein